MNDKGAFTAGGGVAERRRGTDASGTTGAAAFFAVDLLAGTDFISGAAFLAAAFFAGTFLAAPFLAAAFFGPSFLAAAAFFAAFLGAASFAAAPFLAAPAFFFEAALAAFTSVGGWIASSTASLMALDTSGSSTVTGRTAARREGGAGGGSLGVIGQVVSMTGAAFLGARLAAFFAARASSAALAGADSGSLAARVSAVAARLLGPRMGRRGVKIHPTPGTGFPPMSRPSSNSQGCWPWNSWKESLERTTAPVRSAMRRTKASPRPMAPDRKSVV